MNALRSFQYAYCLKLRADMLNIVENRSRGLQRATVLEFRLRLYFPGSHALLYFGELCKAVKTRRSKDVAINVLARAVGRGQM